MSKKSGRKPKKCPFCGAKTVQKIVYGTPGPDFFKHFDHEKFYHGGCIVMPFSPRWHCRTCDAFWGRLEDDPEYFPK